MRTPLTAPPERTTATSRSTRLSLGQLRSGTLIFHGVTEDLIDLSQCRLVERDARGCGIVDNLLGARGADDRRRDVRLPHNPGERELCQRDAEALCDGPQLLHPLEQHLVFACV